MSQEHIWKAAALRVCRTWGVTPPSRNLTIPQLQRWALGPHRWDQLIEAHQRPARARHVPLIPKSTRLIGWILQQGHQGRCPTRFKLIDGGRFFVSYSAESNTLALWDFREAGGAPSDCPRLAASLDLDKFIMAWESTAWCVVDDSIQCALPGPSNLRRERKGRWVGAVVGFLWDSQCLATVCESTKSTSQVPKMILNLPSAHPLSSSTI